LRPVTVQREGHVALAVEAFAGHGYANMPDAVAPHDADDVKIGLQADVVDRFHRAIPSRLWKLPTPVVQQRIAGKCGQKDFGCTGIGGFYKTTKEVGRCCHGYAP
jgi:hypothetical protein